MKRHLRNYAAATGLLLAVAATPPGFAQPAAACVAPGISQPKLTKLIREAKVRSINIGRTRLIEKAPTCGGWQRRRDDPSDYRA